MSARARERVLPVVRASLARVRRALPGDGPDPAAAAASWRAERRAVARTHHPDRGGDVDAYLAALAEVDARHGRLTTAGPPPGRPRARRGTGALRRRARRGVRRARSLLPRGVPGARRWASL
ncbi:hypothetical protein [Aquipuribacter nitratireducens]|uniref:J domain-containing protein n=1 Tax=Aquipuribacter nitratireducens TaxID=650104 RepID=A0ABW0GSQ1_9MICO